MEQAGSNPAVCIGLKHLTSRREDEKQGSLDALKVLGDKPMTTGESARNVGRNGARIFILMEMENTDVGEGMKYCPKHCCWYLIESHCHGCGLTEEEQ